MIPRHILIVEDSEDLRDLWDFTLTDIGYAILSVDDGAKALDEIPRFRPDLILLDFIMPRAEVDGLAFLSRLTADPTITTAPIIVISGLADPLADKITAETAKSLRIVAILSKPVRIDALVGEIQRILGSNNSA